MLHLYRGKSRSNCQGMTRRSALKAGFLGLAGMATVYHVLGIDPRQTFNDHTGRPIPILDEGRPIAEVI